MIAIVNVSADLEPLGWHDYELRINAKVVASFRHRREDGLSVCLDRAAKAAEKAERSEIKAVMWYALDETRNQPGKEND